MELKRAGYRPLLHHLKRSGINIGETKLRRIMKKFELHIKPRKQSVVTTDSNHDCLVYPNLLEGMTIDGINQVWTSDMSYIRIANGFVYLAVIQDLLPREVTGYSISERIDRDLTMKALK